MTIPPNYSSHLGEHLGRDVPMTKTLKTFTLFPLFPYELQEQVWIFAAHLPRVIPLIKQGCAKDDMDNYNEDSFDYRESSRDLELAGRKNLN